MYIYTYTNTCSSVMLKGLTICGLLELLILFQSPILERCANSMLLNCTFADFNGVYVEVVGSLLQSISEKMLLL